MPPPFALFLLLPCLLVFLISNYLAVLPTSCDVNENRRSLCVSLDGTLYFRSRVDQWKLPTGSPLWHSEQNNGNYIFPGEDGNLYEYIWDVGARKLNLTVEKLVFITPLIIGPVTIIGTQTTTLYYVDVHSGELVAQDENRGTRLPGVEEALSLKIASSKSAKYIMTIMRTNYFVTALYQHKSLWNFSTYRYRAQITHKLIDSLGVSHFYDTEVPVFYPRGINISVAGQVPVMRTYDEYGYGTLWKLYKVIFGEKEFRKIISEALISTLLMFPALCYLRGLICSDKQLSDVRVQQTVISKKRKARKSRKGKSGSSIGGRDSLKPSDKGNIAKETCKAMDVDTH